MKNKKSAKSLGNVKPQTQDGQLSSGKIGLRTELYPGTWTGYLLKGWSLLDIFHISRSQNDRAWIWILRKETMRIKKNFTAKMAKQ